MESLLDQLDRQVSELTGAISRYEPIEGKSREFLDLDKQLASEVDSLRRHYDACRRLEVLQQESAELDKEINVTLVGLADCRKMLEEPAPEPRIGEPLVAADLLNYATKIAKFTNAMPGTEGMLPWPTDETIRRGMIAALHVEKEQQQGQRPGPEPQDVSMQDLQHGDSEQPEEPEKKAVPRVERRRPTKIVNLDLLDSDEE